MALGKTQVGALVEEFQSASGNLKNFLCILKLPKIGTEQSVDMEEEDLNMEEMAAKDRYIQLHAKLDIQAISVLLEILAFLRLNILTQAASFEKINLAKTHFTIEKHGLMRVVAMNALMGMIEAALIQTDFLHSSSSSKILEAGE